MKIAIINNKDISGGAARAAYRLYKGFRAMKQDAFMVVKEKKSSDRTIIPVFNKNDQYLLEEKAFLEIQKIFLTQNRTSLSNSAFSLPYPGYDLSDEPFIKDIDIINLHNVRNFQSVESIASLLQVGKPVVWTLHDQMAFTGGCHYSADCEKYQQDCHDCPQLKDNSDQIPFFILNNKIKNWCKNLTIITPSAWLSACAKKSKVLKHFSIHHIPNSLDTDIFRPISKPEAKRKLNINPKSVVLLLGTPAIKAKRKGFHHFVNSINWCRKNESFNRRLLRGTIQLTAFGATGQKFSGLDFPVVSFGKIKSDSELAAIYSAADMFVLPSVEDNLPNTMLESMACATPLIAFAVGGIPEVLKHGETGYLAPVAEEEKMGQHILDLIANKHKRRRMGRKCAQLMQKEFNLSVQAQRYYNLFLYIGKNFNSNKDQFFVPEQIELNETKSVVDSDFYANVKLVFKKVAPGDE